MKRFRVAGPAVLVALCVATITGRGQEELPSYQEIYDLIRANLHTLGEDELKRAAVVGLLGQFKGRAILVTNGTASTTLESDASLVSKATAFDKAYGYLRVAAVSTGLGKAFDSAYEQLQSTNKLKGLVIDLRFAGGHDYPAVGEVASRFIESEQPLFKLGETTISATGTTNPITLPVAALVNRETAGSAEVLAAVLRQADVGLVIGSTTANQAHPFRDFRLSNGQTLKIASGTVELVGGKGMAGVTPDISVNVSLAEEKAYLEDPYRIVARASNLPGGRSIADFAGGPMLTNRFGRRPRNEAELVRMQREGLDLDRDTSLVAAEAAKLTVQDPTLGRALDFLKGMAVVQGRR